MAAVKCLLKISASDDNERLDLASEIWYGGKLQHFYALYAK